MFRDESRGRKSFPDFDSDAILRYLTSCQYLRPHVSVGDVLVQTIEVFGCCPQAVQRALEWLTLDGSCAIGRMRRSELVQLARAVHRFWVQNLASVPEPSPHM